MRPFSIYEARKKYDITPIIIKLAEIDSVLCKIFFQFLSLNCVCVANHQVESISNSKDKMTLLRERDQEVVHEYDCAKIA